MCYFGLTEELCSLIDIDRARIVQILTFQGVKSLGMCQTQCFRMSVCLVKIWWYSNNSLCLYVLVVYLSFWKLLLDNLHGQVVNNSGWLEITLPHSNESSVGAPLPAMPLFVGNLEFLTEDGNQVLVPSRNDV